MLYLFIILAQFCVMMTHASVPECIFSGNFPNDTVFCEGFGPNNLVCTNAKECCQIPQQPECFNMSVIQAYGLWKPPTPIPSPKRIHSCPRKDFLLPQGNNSNKAIDGHVIVQHKVMTVTQCSDVCLRQPRCRGFNLATFLGPEGKKVCELLAEIGVVIDRQGFSFWFFDRLLYEKTILMPGCPIQDEKLNAKG